MPRPAGLIAFGLCLWGTAPWAADPALCPRGLELTRPDDAHLRAHVSAPCDAYQRLSVAYGPFTVAEELSNRGEVSVDLPAISGVRDVVVMLDGTELTAGVPDGSATPPVFVALGWDGAPGFAVDARDAIAHTLGFAPNGQSPRVVVTYLEDAASLSSLPIHASSEQCGKRAVATLITSDHPERRELALTLPPCGPEGLALQLPLSAD